jgi:hypothetical protein
MHKEHPFLEFTTPSCEVGQTQWQKDYLVPNYNLLPDELLYAYDTTLTYADNDIYRIFS